MRLSPRARSPLAITCDTWNHSITRLLTRSVYAGYVEAPTWGVSLRKGHHNPLISLQTYERIQERLHGNVCAPSRQKLTHTQEQPGEPLSMIESQVEQSAFSRIPRNLGISAVEHKRTVLKLPSADRLAYIGAGGGARPGGGGRPAGGGGARRAGRRS